MKLPIFLLLCGASFQSPQESSLSSLDLTLVQQGWGAAQIDRSVEGKPLSIGGRAFASGVGTHSHSALRVALDGRAKHFSSWVGVDDETGGKGSLRFRVVCDEQVVFDSGIMRGGEAAKEVRLSVSGARSLLLLVDDAGDGNGHDHADWADARFEFDGEAPRAMKMPVEEKVILTPTPGPEPRLNGPRVYGVRPGKPFIYRIPASGERPMVFAAEGLPDSIELDAQAGLLVGHAPAEAGEHSVLLRAENGEGSDERELRIVVGDTLALTPPMGWNSWYIHYDRVTQEHMQDAAVAMIASGMADVGYQYVNIDDCWMVKPGSDDPLQNGTARDAGGAVLANGKFPDMSGMVDFIHDLGLKAGIYTSPGETTCAGYVGSLGHEAQDARRFAEWGFDFLKYDWCSYGPVFTGLSRAELRKPFDLISKELRGLDRDVVLNLCQYGMGDVWEWGGDAGGHSWRTTGDLGLGSQDPFQAVLGIGLRNARLHEFARPGQWNDPDYLLFGWVGSAFVMGEGRPTSMSGSEQYSTMSLWSLMAAPLIFSGDMRKLDPFTLNVLCNTEVIEVDQDTLGRQGRIVRLEDDALLMVKPMADGSVAVGLFNLAEYERELGFLPEELGLSGPQRVRDLWRQEDLADLNGEYSDRIGRHDVRLLRLWPRKTAAVTPQRTIDLSGSWGFALDPEDQGISESWWLRDFSDRIGLPGSLQMQGFGDAPSVETSWTGTIIDRSWFDADEYAAYREPGNEKMPFWLQPRRHHVGAAWYSREIDIPEDWTDKHVELHLERCHWTTTLWLDGERVGECESLSTPHVYRLPAGLQPGPRRLTLRVDNRLVQDVGVNAHSVSDHTQTNWNGIIGELALHARDVVRITDVQVHPDAAQRTARVVVTVANGDSKAVAGSLRLDAIAEASASSATWHHDPAPVDLPFALAAGEEGAFEGVYALGADALLWDEFQPALYDLEVKLGAAGSRVASDVHRLRFGLRDLATDGTRFTLNGRPIMLRGTLECCIFPLTGYPPTDVPSWRKIFGRCREFGLNHVRFHSWCPPEAAFIAADELGVYLQPEGPFWTRVGAGDELDDYIRVECGSILERYGNHPSFAFFAHGNEPDVRDGGTFFSSLVSHWQASDSRHLYASASGWGAVPESDFEVTHEPRVQRWGAGLGSRINALPPETATDYRDFVRARNRPVISHEIGQWCVYPDFEEIPLYRGLLQARNFEIFQDTLTANGMGNLARDFLLASGYQQVLAYKEEIESALRTPGFGGFQLLDLHDFPGQGTALVGVLDPFWNPKPYVTAEAFRRFCGPVVPLVRLKQRVFTLGETLLAAVEVANHGPNGFRDASATWRLRDDGGEVQAAGTLQPMEIRTGGLTALGSIELELASLEAPARYSLEVTLEAAQVANDWSIWVFPEQAAQPVAVPEGVHVTSAFDAVTKQVLGDGGRVLLLAPPATVESDVALGFSPVFWNTAWTRGQAPHTLGLLCRPEHPALTGFPTETHSDWHWWELVHGAAAMRLNGLPSELQPIVQPIHTWFENQRLGLLFEARVGGGRLLVCSIDLGTDLVTRPVARQLRASLLRYAAGETFEPAVEVAANDLAKLFRPLSALLEIGGSMSATSAATGHSARNASDGNPKTFWHTPWGADAPAHPHRLVLDLGEPQVIIGLTYLPRQDMANGRIDSFAIYAGDTPDCAGKPLVRARWPNTDVRQTVHLPDPIRARYLILVAESEVGQQTFASAAEVDVLLE